MKNINIATRAVAFRRAVTSFAGPTSGAVHLK